MPTHYILCRIILQAMLSKKNRQAGDLTTKTSAEMCVKQVTLDLEKTSTHCNCKQPCSETKYSYTVASSELNEEFYRTAKAIRTLRIDPNGKLKYIEATDQKSMVGVKVYYNTFQVTMYKEVKSYSWETLIANIGGNLGFFMGLTLVTFFEVFEFLWDFFLTAFKRPKNNKVHILQHTRQRKNFCICSNDSTRNWILKRRKSV
ncbi:acid-sensing ion channel 5-like [Stegodyphus dumicola]|uniref:acid-sensing ion channel 5-like n=1 Tax=Stegodyphus dumicola TaxID=202533 RepID=UPI0015A7B858|nr:acid-sensing ion channel 5-like [Stegodyphus dumicola]